MLFPVSALISSAFAVEVLGSAIAILLNATCNSSFSFYASDIVYLKNVYKMSEIFTIVRLLHSSFSTEATEMDKINS